MKIPLGIIEDDIVLRESIESFFSAYAQIEIVFSLSSIENFLYNEKRIKKAPNIVLIDITLAGLSGIEGISIIRSFYPTTNIIIISGVCNENSVWKAVMAGANGYLKKPFSLKTIIDKIELLTNSGTLISQEVGEVLYSFLSNKKKDRQIAIFGLLTKREIEVVNLLLLGFSYKKIADSLNVSYYTVNAHIKNIYGKLKINSKDELIILFYQ